VEEERKEVDEEKKDLLGKGYLEVEKERNYLKQERKQRLKSKD
jgi:hypothetical protein